MIIESLYPVIILTHIVVGILLLYSFWGKKDLSSTIWVIGSFLFALGVSLVMLGPVIHPFLRYGVTNFCTFFAFFLYVQSIQILFNQGSVRLWIGGLVSLIYGLTIFFLVYIKHTSLVPVFVGCGLCAVHFWAVISLRRLNRIRDNSYVRFFSYLFLVGGVVWLVRALFSQIFKFEFAPDPQLANSLFMVMIAALALLRQISYLLLRFDRTQEEKEIIETLNTKLQQTIEQNNVLIKTLSTSVKANQVGGAVAGIVHELSQPLAAIGINTELLIATADQPADPEWQKEILSYIHQDNQRAAGIIERLRDFYKKGPQNHSNFVLDRLVQGVIELSISRYKAEKVKLQAKLVPDIMVCGDQGQIEMVILNLLTNALNAMTSQTVDSQVLVQLIVEQDCAVLQVTDNGSGIAEDQQQNIFNLFHTTRTQGMGVGLWLSRTIMENHHGRLELVQSQPFSTCFRMTMPLASQNV